MAACYAPLAASPYPKQVRLALGAPVLAEELEPGLSLPEIKSGRIDGANLRGVGWARYGQRPAQHATLVHPCSAIGACEHHCNIFGTIPAGGEDAARRRQRHGQDNPVGSNR